MSELLGSAVVSDAAFVEDEDGIVEFQVGERVCDGKDNAAFLAGDVVKEVDDFAFGPWVESACDLVAEKELGVGDQLHGEPKASLLSSGKDADGAVCDGGEAGFFKNTVDAGIEVFGILGFDAKAGGGFDRFIDRQLVVGDGKLGDVANFPGFQVAVLGEISAIPPEGAIGLGIETRDCLEQGRFSAA